MRKLQLISLLGLASFLCAACAPKMAVYRLTEEAAEKRSGVVYTLPRTLLTAEFGVKHTAVTEGECAQYPKAPAMGTAAEQAARQEMKTLLDGMKVPYTAGAKFELTETKLARSTEPDPTQVFIANVGPRIFNRVDTTIELTEATEISAAKSTQSNEALKFTVRTVTTLVEIAANALLLAAPGGGGDGVLPAHVKMCRDSARNIRSSGESLNIVEVQRSAAIAAGTTTSALDLRIQTLQKDLARLRALFGTTKEKAGTFVCRVAPSDQARSLELFKLNPALGFNTVDPSCAVPAALVAGAGGDSVTLSATETAASTALTELTAKVKISDGPMGFYYRVPGIADVKVEKGTETLQRGQFAVAQFGTINALPQRTGNLWGGEADVTFHPETGGLKKLVAKGADADTESVEKLGSSLAGLTKAVADRDSQADLKALKERLQLEVDIKDLRKKLSATEEVSTP